MIHAAAGGDPDKHPVAEAEQAFLGDQPADEAGLQLAERHPAQRHRERLAAGIAGLPGHDGQEDGKDDELRQRVFENADHRGGDECGQQVDLQPGMAQAQRAAERGREPLLLVDADHLARLGGDLDRLLGEEILAAHEAGQPPRAVADRIDRIMAHDRGLQRVLELHLLAKREGRSGSSGFRASPCAGRAACRASRRGRSASPPDRRHSNR